MALDIDISHYNTGTATVAADGTEVTGQGTTWTVLRKGDLFGTHIGMPVRIAAINSDTSLTLAYPWRGPAQAAAPYEIHRTPNDLGYLAAIEELLRRWGGGNVDALSELVLGARKLLATDPNGELGQTDLSDFMRGLLSKANNTALLTELGVAAKQSDQMDATAGRGLIVGAFGLGSRSLSEETNLNTIAPGTCFFRWGGSTLNAPSTFGAGVQIERANGALSQLAVSNDGRVYARSFTRGSTAPWLPLWDGSDPSNVYRRSNILGTVSQSGGVPTGAIIERGSNTNGQYVRFADGTQICWQANIDVGLISSTNGTQFISNPVSVTFPATFAAPPVLTASATRTSGSGVVWATSTAGPIANTGAPNMYVAGAISGSAAVLHYVATGRWS